MDRWVSSMCLALPLAFLTEHTFLGKERAWQISRFVSCPSRVRASPLTPRNLWSVHFLAHLLGLSDKREISNSSFAILALPDDGHSIPYLSLNSHSVAILPAPRISISDQETNGSLIHSHISVFLPFEKDLLKVNLFFSQLVWLVLGPT